MSHYNPKHAKETQIVNAGRHPEEHYNTVNVPIYHASTILFPTLDELEEADKKHYYTLDQRQSTYARYGTPTTKSLEEALAKLEGGNYCMLFSSGVAAFSCAIMGFVSAGDHILMADTVYGPTRRFCDQELKRFGVETSYFDPRIGADIAMLMKPNTKVVYVESPGSLTFEMSDIPAIAKVAHSKGAVVIGDNTWATPLYSRSFELGMDVSVHSGTKYVGGHSDLVMGIVTVKKEEHYKEIYRVFKNTGARTGPGDS